MRGFSKLWQALDWIQSDNERERDRERAGQREGAKEEFISSTFLKEEKAEEWVGMKGLKCRVELCFGDEMGHMVQVGSVDCRVSNLRGFAGPAVAAHSLALSLWALASKQ